MAYTFEFACSWLSYSEWRVYEGRDYLGLMVACHGVNAYERSIYNGSEAEKARDLDARAGLCTWANNATTPFNPDIAAEFNTKLAADYEAALARFGREFVPESEKPNLLRAGVYVLGEGFSPIA